MYTTIANRMIQVPRGRYGAYSPVNVKWSEESGIDDG